MSAKAYTATIKLTEILSEQTLPAVFVVGDSSEERYALGKVLDDPSYDWLGDYCYFELSEPAWFVAKQGQNVNLGFMVQTDEPITNITPEEATA